MVRLANRNKDIPHHFRFYQPESDWDTEKLPDVKGRSFDTVVRALIKHRLGNRWLTDKHSWATDYESVANEVDLFNALRLSKNPAWAGFIVEDEGGSSASVPFRFPRPRSGPANVAAGSVARTVAGVKTLLGWLGAGGRPVDKATAERRSATCASCPLNVQGSLATWFTEVAAADILKVVGMMSDLKLSTSHDDKLGLCKACGCVNKTKVWVPLSHILAEMKPEVKEALNKSDPVCWVLQEIA